MGKRTLEAPFVPPLKDEDDTRCDHTLWANSLGKVHREPCGTLCETTRYVQTTLERFVERTGAGTV